MSPLMHFPFVSGGSVRATQAGCSDEIHCRFILYPCRLAAPEKTAREDLDKRQRKVVKVKAEPLALALKFSVQNLANEANSDSLFF